MESILEEINNSPQSTYYMQDLQQYLAGKITRRVSFYLDMWDNGKVEFINRENISTSSAKHRPILIV